MFVLDFEASGLNMNLSYPIEVGYTSGVIERECLIIPHPDWDYWSWESQLIHHIPREDLFKYGEAGPYVCQMMNEDLAGELVYIDGGMYDKIWFERLFAYSDMVAEFELSNMPTEMGKAWSKYHETRPTEHRALADAKQIWKFVNDY